MAALYDIVGHAMLSPRTKVYGSDVIAVYTDAAERLLGLKDIPVVTDPDDLATVQAAVAMQVDLMLTVGTEGYVASSVSRGQRSVSYRDDIRLHPLAVELVEPFIGFGRWKVLTSVRG
jgi:hypothetical protein